MTETEEALVSLHKSLSAETLSLRKDRLSQLSWVDMGQRRCWGTNPRATWSTAYANSWQHELLLGAFRRREMEADHALEDAHQGHL